LEKALKVAPDNAAANFNMGLLKAEENDLVTAEKRLRAALKADPHMAQAAYNLCIILSKDRLDEAIDFCSKAAEIRPDQPKYAYTLAFFRRRNGDVSGAADILEGLINRRPTYPEAYMLLGRIYEKEGKKAEAERVYKKGMSTEGLPAPYKVRMKMLLEAQKGGAPDEQKK
jgi:predicted Zn-dependent protease